MTDMINHPDHYAGHYSREVIELAELLDFCNGNAVKYILRSPWKGSEVEDLRKAKWYVRRQMNSGIDEWFDEETEGLFKCFMGDLLEQGRDLLYRALLGVMKHDYKDSLEALSDAIDEAKTRPEPPELDEAFL